jgi:Raf kinase inhibitor-like YbhB/YbcL family protein
VVLRRITVVDVVALVMAAMAAGGGCGGSGGGGGATEPAPSVPATVRVSSPAFGDGQEIPEQFTCRGGGQSPPLNWSTQTRADAQALVVDDPDAPGGNYVHWVVLDLPASSSALPAGGQLPTGARQAQNSTGRPGWAPPCPPSGTHHYRFTVYLLSAPTRLADGVATDDALAAIGRLATGRGRLVGLVTHR